MLYREPFSTLFALKFFKHETSASYRASLLHIYIVYIDYCILACWPHRSCQDRTSPCDDITTITQMIRMLVIRWHQVLTFDSCVTSGCVSLIDSLVYCLLWCINVAAKLLAGHSTLCCPGFVQVTYLSRIKAASSDEQLQASQSVFSYFDSVLIRSYRQKMKYNKSIMHTKYAAISSSFGNELILNIHSQHGAVCPQWV